MPPSKNIFRQNNCNTKPNYLQQADITIATNQILRCNIKLRTHLNKTKSRLVLEVTNISRDFIKVYLINFITSYRTNMLYFTALESNIE